jgi:hypothetical protein
MITQAYILNSTNQLIDINDAYSSFTTLMNVTCENLQDSFEYAIINQTTLDSNQFKFNKATGFWEDSFTINQDNFQNWYLVLRSDKDTKCTVNLNITPLNYDSNPTQSPVLDKLPQIRPNPKLQPQQPSAQNKPHQQPQRVAQQPQRVAQQPQKVAQQPQRVAQQPRPQSKPRPNSQPKLSSVKKPRIEYEGDDDEDYDENVTTPRDYSKYYKYIGYGVITVLFILFALWWTGYIDKVPFINKFFQKSVSTVLVNTPPPSAAPVNTTLQMYTQQPPSVQSIDTNFINEMRELKIDL